ncbi:MAG: hypothetical protein EOO13_05325 [Chitinophagaceae bacterium]|nr:MAG: hypothetical protein EOO13_05325 [Chitinophagaceae bacterium]
MSVFILLAILATDIYLHKGMSRVILPDGFTKMRSPQQGLPRCSQVLQIKGKKWMKAVNTVALAKLVDSSTYGIELDVYFDTTRNSFFVYHDTAVINTVTIDDIFSSLQARQVAPPVWLDFKNLSPYNKEKSLQFLLSFRNRYQLADKIIVESPHPELLQSFCNSDFYTSYYVPFFNPYQESDEMQASRIDSISALLKKNPVSALSGYYFQTPFLKKFFPALPVLTWTEDDQISLVSRLFHHQLEKDSSIKVLLYNIDL